MEHDEHVPNLRPGPSAWLTFFVGPLLGALVVAVAAIIAIARMPDGAQFQEITHDVAAIKQDVAVSRARQEAAAALSDERNEYLKAQLRELLGRRGK